MNKIATIKIKLEDLNLQPLTIAKYFYQKGVNSHLVIQKLIYFSFLEGLRNDWLLFPEKFQAWKYGPVLRSVFDNMTGASDLDTTFAKVVNLRRKNVVFILEKIYQTYCHYDVWDLVEKSHNGPWTKARNDLNEEETSTEELDLKELISFANAQK